MNTHARISPCTASRQTNSSAACPPSKRSLVTSLAGILAWLHFASVAPGAVFYWDGQTSTSWNVNTNWSDVQGATTPDPATAPGLGGATSLANDQVVFNTAAAIANQIATLDAAINVNKITFDANATTAITLAAGTGGSLTLGTGGIQVDAGSGAHTISAAVALGTASPQNWLNNSASLFTVSGTVALGTNALTFDGSGDFTISGIMSGSGTLTKSGAGTLTFLTADPSATGAMTINGGRVVLNHSGAIDFNVTVNNTATFQTTTASVGDSVDVTVNAGGTFEFNSGNDTMGGLAGAGTVTRTAASAGTLTVGNGGEITTFSGLIENGAGTVGLSKTGTGTLTLTGANTFTGTLSVVNGSATAGTYSLVIAGANGSVATNTINVGDNNGGNESLRIGATTDVWTTGALNRISDGATITLNGTASTNGLAFQGPATGSTGNVETIGTLAINLGRNYVTLVPGTGNELQINSTSLTRTGNGTLFLRGDNLGGTGVGSTRFVVTGTAPLTGSGGASGTDSMSIVSWAVGDNTSTGAGSGFLTHDVNGLRLLTAGEYSGTIAGSGATLRNVTTAGGETVSANEVFNSLRVTGGTTTIADGVRMRPSSGAVLFTAASTIGGANGFLDFGTSQGIIHVAQNTAAITTTINARVAGTNGLAVGSIGNVNNILVLAGDNTVVGTVVVNSGIIRAGSSTAFNDNFAVTINARAGTTVQLFGNNVTLRDLQGGSGSGVYQNGAATAATLTTYLTAARTLTTAMANGSTGALNLVVSGNTLTLNAGNTYTGTTEIRSGTITLSGNNTGHINASSSVTVYGGTLRLTNTSGNVLANRISDTGTVSLIAGTFDFDNNASAASFSETDAGVLSLVAGANTVTVDKAASGQTSTVTFDSLSRTAGATVNFTSQTNGTAVFDLGTTTQSRLVFTAAPSLDDGIIGGWATTNSSATQLEFVKYVTSGVVSVTALTGSDYTLSLASGANATQNVKINATPAALTSNTQINSLNVQQTSATTVDLGGNILRVESGGVIVSGDFNSSFINGNLTAGTGDNTAGELIFHTVGAVANPVVIDAVITDNGSGSVSLVKTGAGMLDLQGVTNTYTGKTTVNGGVLRIDSDANLGTAPGAPSAGHLTLMGGARLDIMLSFTMNENRSIVIGPGVNTINIASGTAGQGKTLTCNGSITNFGTGEGSLTIESNAVATTGVDVGEFNGNLTALNLGGTLRFEAGVITVAGTTSEIGRSLQIGMDGVASLTYSASGGSLKVGQGINEVFELGVNSSNVLNTTGSLDVSALQNFRVDVATIRLGIGSAGFTGRGTMLLATNSEITAGTSIILSNSTGAGQEGAGVQSSIRFGEGMNSVMTPLMTVGGLKGNGMIDIEAGGTLKLSGFGQRTMTLRVGSNVGNTGTLSTGLANISNGTLVGDFDTIVLGEKSGGGVGGGDGTLTLGFSAANAVETNTLVLGTMAGASGTATGKSTSLGELIMGGGSFIVHGDMSMGIFGGTIGTARGMLSLTGGAFTVGGNIVKTDSDRSAAVITVDGASAVLDMRNDAYDDATKGTIAASQLIFRNGSIVDVESATLDGRSVTDGDTFGSVEDALILRDVTVDFDVFLTHVTAGLGGILYESAGGGSGGVINGDVDLGGVDRDFNVQNNVSAAADLTVAGQVSNAGILNKLGAGTLVLTHTSNSYGSTTVSEGTLQVGLNGVGTTGLGVTFVAQNATLAGSGTVTAFNPAVTTHIVEGNLSPGDLGGAAVGNLKFQGNLSLAATAVTTIQLGSPTTPGVTYDQITGVSSNDTIILDGSINAAEAGDGFFGGYVGAAGDTWQILMDWTTLNLASFNVGTNMRTGVDGLDEGDLDLPTLGAGLFWDVSNFATNGSVQISAVPEPGRAMLLLIGVAGLVLRRRRMGR